jgi:hypothetical protein
MRAIMHKHRVWNLLIACTGLLRTRAEVPPSNTTVIQSLSARSHFQTRRSLQAGLLVSTAKTALCASLCLLPLRRFALCTRRCLLSFCPPSLLSKYNPAIREAAWYCIPKKAFNALRCSPLLCFLAYHFYFWLTNQFEF